MKIKIFKIMFLLLFPVLLGAGCDKEESLSVCGIKDPLVDLDWLRDLKTKLEEDTDISSAKIVLYRLDSDDFIYVQKNIRFGHDFPNSIYNCEGGEEYVCGGNQPVDDCTTFFSNAQKIKILWTKKL